MRSSILLYGAIASLVLGAGVLTADALVTTDEEHLEELCDDVTERDADARVGAIMTWTDLSRQPLEISDRGRRERYEERDEAALSHDLEGVLAPLTDPDLEILQRSVEVDDDRATIAIRTRSGGETHNTTFRLTRNGQGWLITRLRAS
ncbi:MAG: hypothetical protein AB8I08_01710 [Sandaracinaceae bacterium]